ncbi:MAG: winged helix-turn-helix transcriptional regulator [Woeseiaceae bacterium]|nr:winged helix-turn-helix transcriptional regulator [Woeseiaceae bacterium]
MTDSSHKMEINAYVPCQMAALTHSIMRSLASVLELRFNISVPEWKVLAIIAEKPGLSAVAVAHLAEMDTVAVSRAVSKLMDRNLVARELDNEDRRRSILNLSPAGLELYADISPLAADLEASLFENFTDDEKRVFEKAIATLRAKSVTFADAFQRTPRNVMATRPTAHAANGDRFRPRVAPLLATPLNGRSGAR